MKIAMKMVGADQLTVKLRNLGEKVADRARKTMRRNADIIEREAKLNAPRDTGALEDSIHQVLSYGFRNRLQIDIECGGFVDGVNVDEYAAMIHENYESLHPGAGTVAKRLANPGRYIGSKFLERAFEAQRDKLLRDAIEDVNESIRESGL